MDYPTLKKQVRAQVLDLCQHMSDADRYADQQAIYQQFLSLPEFIHSHTVLAYASCLHETDTYPLLSLCLEMKKKLLLPKVDMKNRKLLLFQIQSLEKDLVSGYANILEPAKHCLPYADNAAIDLIIVPAVAFSLSGQRLGRGMGFYDRFLPTHPESKKIGLAYRQQIVDALPVEEHDHPIDLLVSPDRIVNFDDQMPAHE